MLFVGNLLAVKGADRLPRIFSLVAKTMPGVRMDIVGADAGEGLGEAIRAEAVRSGHSGAVLLLGALEPREVADLMRRSDLLIVPSRSEGFGCVAVEAQACGTPVLGSATGGLPEAIGDVEMTVAQDGDFEAAFAEKAVAVLLSRRRRVRPDLASLTWGELVRAERKIYEVAIARA
jgi:glycosyltransferase involved in cell wall biosynthesis